MLNIPNQVEIHRLSLEEDNVIGNFKQDYMIIGPKHLVDDIHRNITQFFSTLKEKTFAH